MSRVVKSRVTPFIVYCQRDVISNFDFYFQHHEQVEKYSTTLETLLFTQDLDPNILDVFQQFVALRM